MGVRQTSHPADALQLNISAEAARELYAALDDALEALIWASGSADFGEDGCAREGFQKLHKPAIARAFSALSLARREKPR